MFEPLASGLVDSVAARVHSQGLRFGFGGIARLNEGLVPGRDVLAEHVRLGSAAVILSRTFHRPSEHNPAAHGFEAEVAALRQAERDLSKRTSQQVESDRSRISGLIESVVASTIRRSAEGMA